MTRYHMVKPSNPLWDAAMSGANHFAAADVDVTAPSSCPQAHMVAWGRSLALTPFSDTVSIGDSLLPVAVAGSRGQREGGQPKMACTWDGLLCTTGDGKVQCVRPMTKEACGSGMAATAWGAFAAEQVACGIGRCFLYQGSDGSQSSVLLELTFPDGLVINRWNLGRGGTVGFGAALCGC